MCLGIPAKIIEINKEKTAGKVDISGVKKEINIQLVPEVKTGDYVLLHAGFAIQILDEKEAKETISLLNEFLE